MTDLRVADNLPAEETSGANMAQEEEEPGIDPATLKPDQQTAYTLMEGICASTGQGVRPRVRAIQGVYMHVDLVGDDVRATWGRMGQSLDALQMLANMILSRRVGSDVRLMLDADNYRERRAETLRGIAQEYAREVKDRNQEAEMDPSARPRAAHHPLRPGRRPGHRNLQRRRRTQPPHRDRAPSEVKLSRIHPCYFAPPVV